MKIYHRLTEVNNKINLVLSFTEALPGQSPQCYYPSNVFLIARFLIKNLELKVASCRKIIFLTSWTSIGLKIKSVSIKLIQSVWVLGTVKHSQILTIAFLRVWAPVFSSEIARGPLAQHPSIHQGSIVWSGSLPAGQNPTQRTSQFQSSWLDSPHRWAQSQYSNWLNGNISNQTLLQF